MRIRRAFGVLLIGSVLLVGCSKSDDNASSGSDADASTGSTARSGVTTGATTGDANIDSARCVGAATAMAQAAGALTGSTSGIQASVDQFEAFAEAAPSEIKADLRTVATGYSDFVKVLSDANYNPASGQAPSPEVQAKIEAATQKLDKSDFQEAANRVTAWFQAGCKS